MTKRDQKVEMSSGSVAAKDKPRRPYKKPQLAIYGKIAELTAGINGTLFDPGLGTLTRRSSGSILPPGGALNR
jgi:hypothetical protein